MSDTKTDRDTLLFRAQAVAKLLSGYAEAHIDDEDLKHSVAKAADTIDDLIEQSLDAPDLLASLRDAKPDA